MIQMDVVADIVFGEAFPPVCERRNASFKMMLAANNFLEVRLFLKSGNLFNPLNVAAMIKTARAWLDQNEVVFSPASGL